MQNSTTVRFLVRRDPDADDRQALNALRFAPADPVNDAPLFAARPAPCRRACRRAPRSSRRRWGWRPTRASRACPSACWPRSRGMSKSGVFAHFGSREELQISVIRELSRKFEEEVFCPAMPRAARPAAAARDVRALGARVVVRDRLGLHLHQRRRRVRRPSGPGARRAGHDGAGLAGRAHALDPAGHRRRPPAAATPTPSRWCSRSTA